MCRFVVVFFSAVSCLWFSSGIRMVFPSPASYEFRIAQCSPHMYDDDDGSVPNQLVLLSMRFIV